MQRILFLKDCDKALEAKKPQNMSEDAWVILNKKAVTHIKMVVSDEILVDLKGLIFASKIWAKLKATYKNTTLVNQVQLMRKLVGMQLDESKCGAEHLSLFTGILSQLQYSRMAPFDDKLKAIFLLMTLLDSWETLVVSLSNNPNLTFDGVRGSILNEETRRKASGEGGSSANMVRGRIDKRSNNAHRNKSKSKEIEIAPKVKAMM